MIERKFKEQRPQFWPLTIFIALSCIIPLFFVHGTHDLMIIGAIAVTLCFFLHFLSYFPQKIQCYQSLFWYLALAFCCPFIASYQMVISHYQIFWLLNALFIMVFLGIFVDWLSYLMISALGIACAYIYHNYTVVGHREMIVTSYIGYFITYCYIIAAIIIKIIKGEQKAELHRKDIVGAAIAHEMMGPFAMTQSALEALQTLLMRKVCPTASGEENNILHIEMKKADYDTLRKIADEIVDIAKDGKKTIDMLLMSLRDKIVADDIAIYSITNCIEEALLRYDFKPGEKKAVTFRKTNDFDFKGSKHFVKHILFNLLRNSFQYANSRYGDENFVINIWLENEKIHFKDNGVGMGEDDLQQVFDGLRTGSPSDTGIGLAFCRMVMEEMGGSIECDSVRGKYTEVTLDFPTGHLGKS